MKSYLKVIAVAAATLLPSVASYSADAAPSTSTASASSPAGTWQWNQPGRDGATYEQRLKLNFADGKLTGTVLGGQRGDRQIPDAEISNATFADNTIGFSVTREFNGNQIVTKYSGKLEGDTIKGTIERPSRDGGAPRTNEWNATRAK